MLVALVIIDLTSDDDETVVSDLEVDVLEGPVWLWRDKAMNNGQEYEAPPGLLVEIQEMGIEENGCLTPQIVGEAERRFAQFLARVESLAPADEEANRLVNGIVAPEYNCLPSYFE